MKSKIASGNGRAGFSMIEVLVAMAIMAIVLAGLITVFASEQRTFAYSTELSKAQAAARASLALMTRDLRMAGYSGIPLGFDELSRQGALYPIVPQSGGEAIEICGNFSRQTTGLEASTPISATTSVFTVADVDVMQGAGINTPAGVMVGNANRQVEFHTFAQGGNPLSLTGGATWTRDYDTLTTIVAPFMRRRYWVDNTTHQLKMRNCNTLDFTDHCPSGTEAVLADGIERIEFSYGLTDSAGSTLNTNQTMTCNPCLIRTVIVKLWTRTENRLKPGAITTLMFSSAVKVRNIGFETTTCPITSGCP